MLSTTETIGICLFELPDKDQAVIQRVITFGASQGKHYNLQPEATCAQIIVTLDNIPTPPCHAVTVRIGEPGELECDLLLQRPLLVTKVMRAIDDAAQMYRTQPTPEAPAEETPKEEAVIPPSQHETQPESPTPEKTASQLEPAAISEHSKEASTVSAEQDTHSKPEAAQEAPASESNTIEATETATEATEAETRQTEEPATSTQEEMPQVINSTEDETTTELGGDADYNHLALVVDDSAAIRKQLEIELRNANIKADFAETGEEALEKSAQKEYDLVFLDIIMPGIDGYEVCRQMRARKAMKKTPIIMLSGKTSPLDEVQGVIAGASTYLTKPVKHEQFQQTLKRVSKWLTEFAR